jgi:hypothetical protein
MLEKLNRKVILSALIALVRLGTSDCARSPQAKEARFISRGKEAMSKKDYGRASLEFLNAVQVMPQDAKPITSSARHIWRRATRNRALTLCSRLPG